MIVISQLKATGTSVKFYHRTMLVTLRRSLLYRYKIFLYDYAYKSHCQSRFIITDIEKSQRESIITVMLNTAAHARSRSNHFGA